MIRATCVITAVVVTTIYQAPDLILEIVRGLFS